MKWILHSWISGFYFRHYILPPPITAKLPEAKCALEEVAFTEQEERAKGLTQRILMTVLPPLKAI